MINPRTATVVRFLMETSVRIMALLAFRHNIDILTGGDEAMAGDDQLIAGLQAADDLDAVALDDPELDLLAHWAFEDSTT